VRQLAALLRRLLLAFEGGVPAGDVPRLGIVLAPAHVARRRRASVGLPERTGLLVTAVEPGGPAAQGGLREGDLLVAAAARAVPSVLDLGAAARALAPGDALALRALRGADEIELSVVPAPAAERLAAQARPPAGAPPAGQRL